MVAVCALGKDQPIVETRNVPLAVTVFRPNKPHTVKTHWRLAFHQLKLTPYASQTFDHGKTALGLRLDVGTSFPAFTFASVMVVADEKEIYRADRDWDSGIGGQGTSIENSDLVRQIANGKEVYLSVLFSGQQPPFDHISFRLSPEQLADCKMMLAKFDELMAGVQ